MFPLSFSIPLQNGPLFVIISICSCNAVYSDVIQTLVFFLNNCRLTNVSFIQFENKHFELVARWSSLWKNTNGFGNIRLITLPGAAFLC